MFNSFDGAANPLNVLIDYNKLFKNIPEEWRQAGGKGIKIGIIDTGVNKNHPDFENCFNNKSALDFTGDNQVTEDIYGHGTPISGIIGARATSKGIRGVAPLSDIFMLKAGDNNGNFSSQALNEVLDWLASNKMDILNLSLSISYPIYMKILPKLNQITDTVMVASAGENDVLTNSSFLYPAMNNRFISVGAINRVQVAQINSALTYMMPLLSFQSCSNNLTEKYKEEIGSSVATAMMSGVIALYLSTLENKIYDKEEIIKVLDIIAVNYPASVASSEIIIIKP